MSSEFHSFDINLAAEHGIEEAIMIHHFIHWISLNKRQKKNTINGVTWSYQTQDWILAHYPYFKNRDKVLRLINSLVEKGILQKGNFNKSKYDRTNWYAFVDESKYLKNVVIHPGLIDNVQKCTMVSSELHNQKCETAQPIPDTKTDPKEKKKINKKDAFANASALSLFFYDELKKRKAVVPIPKRWSDWNKPLNDLLSSGAGEEHIKKMIVWAFDHKEFWAKTISKPQNLYNSYISLEGQMNQPKKTDDYSYASEVTIKFSNERFGISNTYEYIEFLDRDLEKITQIEFGPHFKDRVNDFLKKTKLI